MKYTTAIFTALGFLVSVKAQSSTYGQCGGQGWTGATTCVSGYTCTYSNPYYSQCLPGTASTTTKPTTSPTTTPGGGQTSTSTSTGPAPTGSQIRSVQDPVYHFYLQNSGGTPVLGPVASSGYFTLGTTIALNNANGSKSYLNVNETVSTSYKPLSFGATATTTDWGLEGDTIVETSPRQLNFLTCATTSSTIYNVYLQEGNDQPVGQTCTLITLHLPCLC